MKRNALKLSTVILFLFLICSYSLTFSEPESPFKMIGWQLHELDRPRIAEAIQLAPDYGVNFVVFSHNIFRSVEEFLSSPDRQEDLRYFGALADEKKIPCYLWIHELDDIPKRFQLSSKQVNFDDPQLFPFLEDRYERLLKAMPNVAGFVLTLREVHYLIFRNSEVKSDLSFPDRIVKLTTTIYNVAKRHNKQLILRDFFYEPQEMAWFKQALDRLPDDIIVMSKDTCHEFNPFYPPDPMHGNVGKKRQIMELDLCVEKAFASEAAYAQVDEIRKYVRRTREKGLIGAVGRVRMLWDKPFEDPHEINFYAFACLMRNPDMPVDEIYDTWGAKRYPAQAASYIVSALKRTEYINHHGRYHLEFWLTKSVGEKWDHYSYYFGHIVRRSRYKWTQDPADKELENLLLYPDMKTYERLVAEKDEVLRQIEASKADLEKAAKYVSPERMKPLADSFDFLQDAGNLSKEWTRAFFAHRLFIRDPKEEYRNMAEDALKNLEKLDKAPGVTYGLDAASGHRYCIDVFVAKMRSRMEDRDAAIKEDDDILKKMRQKAETGE